MVVVVVVSSVKDLYGPINISILLIMFFLSLITAVQFVTKL